MVTLIDFLDILPMDEEMRRRAELNAKIQLVLGYPGQTLEDFYAVKKTKKGEDFIEYRWDDAGGQTTHIIFFQEYTLVMVFDHESVGNFYTNETGDLENQLALYDNLPDPLKQFVFDRIDADDWILTLDTPEGHKVELASTVAWWDGIEWEHSPRWNELVKKLNWRNEQGDMPYCMAWFVDTQPLTIETVMKHYADGGFDDDQELFDKIRQTALENL